jgi:hypothetical protein
MLVCLLVYAYCVGVFSSRKIARACERNLAFLAIVGEDRPVFRTISDFRKLHLEAFVDIVVQVLRIAAESGLVKLGNVSTDGTKLQGNASRHKADAEAERKRRAEAEAERKRTGQKRRCRAPKEVDETPGDTAQMRFTDPELKIMQTNNKGWDSCGNAQASVDGAHQIIVACDVTAEANDKQQAVPMAQLTVAKLEQAGMERPKDAQGLIEKIPGTCDSGYYSEAAAEAVEQLGCDPSMATGRQRHHVPEAEVSASPQSAKERMAAKVRTPEGRALYARRKVNVEPVCGQIKEARGFRRLCCAAWTTFVVRGVSCV